MSKRTYSYWEIEAGIDRRSPSNGLDLSKNALDILIVGAGFSGSWLAYFLKKKNPTLKIAIVERDFFNLGASTRNAGFLSCGNISEWLADSKDFTWEDTLLTLKARIDGINILRSELGSHPSFSNCGSADLDPITEEKLDLMQRLNGGLRSLGYKPLFETRNIDFAARSIPVFFNTFDSETNPCDLLLRLHEQLKESGVHFIWQTSVKKLGEGQAVLVRNSKPYEFQYRYAFICTNAFARDLNRKTVVRPARGQILVTTPTETATTPCLGFLESGYDYFRFIGKRVLVGGGRLAFKAEEDTEQLDVTPEIREYLINLATLVIGHSDFKVEHHWSGIMGLRCGKHSSITDLQKRVIIDSKTEEVAGFGGWGVTLTPYVTRHLADKWSGLNGEL